MSVTEFSDTPTDGGIESGSDQIQTETQAPAQTQAERTFRQADVDRIVQERLTRERQKFERQQYTPPPQQNLDPIEARLSPFLSQVEDLALESKISKLGRQYPDFAQNEETVLQHAMDLVRDNPAWANHPKLLETAYKSWKYDSLQSIDVEAIKKQASEEAVKSYLKDKQAQAATAPKVEGKGGSTPTTGSPKVNWKNADELAKRLIAQNKQHQG